VLEKEGLKSNVICIDLSPSYSALKIFRSVAVELLNAGVQIFLDMKLHDIPK
jgi:orotidine-5'-phosphate decarboxylase